MPSLKSLEYSPLPVHFGAYNSSMKTAALSFLIFPALLFTASATLSAPHIHKEAYYRDLWCQVNHGRVEVRQPNGTIADCVTGAYAVGG